MRRLIFAAVAALVIWACVSHVPVPTPGVWVIEAQSLPVTKTLAWDAVPDPCQPNNACPVTSYTVSLDGTVIGTPTWPSQSFTITGVGDHTLTVFATNMWGNGPSATLIVSVKVPAKPANPVIQ